MAGFRGHLNISADYVLQAARDKPQRSRISLEGRDLYGDEQITVIEEAIAAGCKWFSSCPTPNEDGSCPTHPLDEETSNPRP